MCVVCGEIRSLTLADQGVAEGHVVVLGHQLSDIMACPCVCNQLSQQLGYSHLVVMCTCVASARYGITVVYRMTVEPVGGGGGGGSLPLTALHHGEGRGRDTLLTALGESGVLPVDSITPKTPVTPLAALMLTFDLTQTEATQYIFHCVLHVCSL